MGVISYEVPINVQRMTIGVQGENNVREFLFDVTEWRQLTGDIGAAEMVVQRNGDASPYAAVITMHDENTVSWVPTSTDTEKVGAGKLQLMWIAGGQTVKTKIFDMKVDPSLDYAVPDTSLDPWASWMPGIINADANYKGLTSRVDVLQQRQTSPYNFKGSVATLADLPSTGQEVNDTYYVKTLKYRVTWTGDAWQQSSMEESKYTDELAEVKSALSDTAGSYLPNSSRSQGYKNLLNLVHIVDGAYYWNNAENASSYFHYGKLPVKAGDILTLNRCRFGWFRNMSGVGSSVYNVDGALSTITITQDGTLYVSFSNINPHVCYGSSDVAEDYISEIENVQAEIDNVQAEIDNAQAEIDSVIEEKQGSYLLVDDGIEWHNGVKYFNGYEYTGGSYDGYHFFYLDVTEGDVISSTANFRNRCEFNGNTVVSEASITDFKTYTVPAGVNRIALTRAKSQTAVIIFTGTIYTIKKQTLGNVSDIVVKTVQSTKNLVAPENTTIFDFSPNLVDPAKEVIGQFVNQMSGAFNDNASQTRSDYINVTAGARYYLTTIDNAPSGIRYAAYDFNKIFIPGSGALVPDTTTDRAVVVTMPDNAAYLVMSYGRSTNGQMFVGLYDGSTMDFYPFYEKIKDKYLSLNGNAPVLNLPAKIYALVGYELNVYFENLTEHYEKYDWNVICSKGMQLERGYRITPTADDVGAYTLSIRASVSDDVFSEVTTTLIVTNVSAGSGVSMKVMVLGDSTTNNGIAVRKLNDNFSDDVMSIQTIGTRGTAPYKHEGRSGWTFYSYFNPPNAGDIAAGVENPWYNPSTETFDADYYFANSGIEKPDWLFINLGINDTFGYTSDTNLDTAITTIKGRCDAMIASIKSASPSTKIGLCLTIPPNRSQDAFGKAYANGQTRNRYKRNNVIWVHDLIETYDSKENEGIYLIPIYTNLDTVNNMGFETLPVNARNQDITYQSPIGNGGVHPVESGYWQIADVYTAFLKAYAN